jgi:glutathione S-transferase
MGGDSVASSTSARHLVDHTENRPMKLYNNDFSPNAKRVRVVAKEVGANLEVVQLDFMKGDHRAPNYLAKNPNGKIPTFEDADGTVVWESPAILVYFAEKYPQKGLLPSDPMSRTRALQWMFWNASHLESALFAVAFERLVKPMLKMQADEARITSALADVGRFAPIFNGHLEGKQWVCGDKFSIADICIGTTVEFAGMAQVDFSAHKHLGAWLSRLQARDSWK